MVLSRRDSTIAARHEVPGLEFGHMETVKPGKAGRLTY
jgi:hypothetical protein